MSQRDQLQRLVFEHIDARAVWVSLDDVLADVIRRGGYEPAVADLLSRALLISAAMSSGIKFEGRITLQLQGSEILPVLLADCTADGGLRGMAHKSESGTELPPDPAALFASMRDSGVLSLTLEPSGQGRRWQGVVPLEGDTLEAAIARYFDRSEQLPTRFRLAVGNGRAAAVMIQQMPDQGGDSDGFNRLGQLLGTLSDEELLALPGEQIFQRLFHEEPRRLFPPRSLHFHCPCTRERVARVLVGLGRDDLRELTREQEVVEVRCEFCNEAYRFDQVDLSALIEGGPGEKSSTVH